ncbi:ribokinase [Microbacterium aurum]
MSGRVTVVGSANIDLVYRVAQIPEPGETVSAASLALHPGGKGLNQAVAAQRAGADTAFIASIGADDHGDMLRTVIDSEGLDATNVRRAASPTGTAIVTTDDSGENNIVILAGANAELTTLTDADIALIRASDVLVLQLEVPDSVVFEAADIAHRAGTTVVLNPAPVRTVAEELLRRADILIANEHEAAQLHVDGLNIPCIVTTLGSAGATVTIANEQAVEIPARPTRAVDTTGAGDTFVGTFAAEIAFGTGYEAAARRASIAGSLAVETRGAVPSIPTRQAVDDALAALEQEQR